MTNVLAIAQKELRSYFASPIAYIVIGMWALLYGYFYASLLQFFVRQSMQMSQMGMQGPQAMNLNQQMVRPLLQNVTILILFLVGGEVTKGFAFAMLIGVVTGTYSSIFVAAPMLIDLAKNKPLGEADTTPTAAVDVKKAPVAAKKA